MHIYLCGIGGMGMSAYAGHMLARGHAVSGSDMARSAVTQALEDEGARISYAQDGKDMPEDIDLFVYSEAIPDDAPERKEARRIGIKCLSYFQALGELTRGTDLIAVAGTHGKSTTTAMIARMLLQTGRDPSVVVGTLTPELDGKNWRSGKDGTWLVEACEYRGSFLHLQPKIIVLTNIDYDHHDAFPTPASYESAYAEFVAKLPPSGVLLYHGSDPTSARVAKERGGDAIDVGDVADITLAVPGAHMRENAKLALALAGIMKIDPEKAASALSGYRGSARRMERRGSTAKGTIVFDDYAHHPTEIVATLSAMRELFPDARIVCAFQPHTHDRTLAFWDGFAHAFADADAVVVTDVYDARPDREGERADAEKLVSEIAKKSGVVETLFGGPLARTTALLQTDVLRGERDVLIVMGAGNCTQITASLLAT